MRIRSRAIRRAGELLRMFDGKPGPKSQKELRVDTDPQLSRKKVGEQAGLSEGQIKQAVRVAGVPEKEFEDAVESDNPPTLTALAEKNKGYEYLT